MGSLRRFAVAITTAADGSFTGYTPPLAGFVHQVRFVDTDLDDTADITVTEEDTGAAIVTLTNQAATATFMPRGATHDTAGAASLYAAAGEPVEDRIPAFGRIKVVVAQGGNAKTGTLYVYVEASEVFRTSAT